MTNLRLTPWRWGSILSDWRQSEEVNPTRDAAYAEQLGFPVLSRLITLHANLSKTQEGQEQIRGLGITELLELAAGEANQISYELTEANVPIAPGFVADRQLAFQVLESDE